MDRKLRTKRGRALYRQRGAAIEPEFGQMKDRQGADRFSMRSLARAAEASGSSIRPQHAQTAPGSREKSRNRRGEGQEDGLIRRPSGGRHTDLDSAMAP